MNEPATRKEIEVKPAPGIHVAMPGGEGHLPEGKWSKVPHNRYWARRVAQGDVVRRGDDAPAKTGADKTSGKKD